VLCNDYFHSVDFFTNYSMTIPCGLYRHYKGNDYFVFQVATHSETRESLVFYRCLYGDYSWWVRPLDMFMETVELAGETIPRFLFVRSVNEQELMAFMASSVNVETISGYLS